MQDVKNVDEEQIWILNLKLKQMPTLDPELLKGMPETDRMQETIAKYLSTKISVRADFKI